MNLTVDNKDIELSFDRIAKKLLLYHVISINKEVYTITELEFYYHSQGHEDPYVHQHAHQLSIAKWYFHGSGLDITIGNGKDIYGGILIRGVKNSQGTYIDGPLNVVTNIFHSIGSVNYAQHDIGIKPIAEPKSNKLIAKSTRVNLKKKENDTRDFHGRLYRYLIEIETQHRFSEKMIVAEQLMKTGQFSKDEINKMFGYKIV